MKKILMSVGLLSVSFMGTYEVADACTMLTRTQEEAFASSTIVARGKIISVTENQKGDLRMVQGKMIVDTYWKGNGGKEILITSNGIYTCSPSFGKTVEGGTYLIYATYVNPTEYIEGGYYVSSYQGILSVDEAETSKTIERLGKGHGPAENISTTTTPVTFEFNRNLTVGYSGVDVIELQSKLETLGYLKMPPGVAKGFFGQLTRKALIEYQVANNINPAVGYFGSLTRQSLNRNTSQ